MVSPSLEKLRTDLPEKIYLIGTLSSSTRGEDINVDFQGEDTWSHFSIASAFLKRLNDNSHGKTPASFNPAERLSLVLSRNS